MIIPPQDQRALCWCGRMPTLATKTEDTHVLALKCYNTVIHGRDGLSSPFRANAQDALDEWNLMMASSSLTR